MNELFKKRCVSVLGFYNRKNLGDEAYKIAFNDIFKDDNLEIKFYCTDDIKELPNNTDIVIVGGGDVINEYFMNKINILLKGFTGPIYAFSVGIPYLESGLKYLNIFDHIFVRNYTDYELASKAIGDENVTQIPDACFILKNRLTSSKDFKFKSRGISTKQTRTKYGIALAQPLFHKNAHKNNLLQNLSEIYTDLNNEIHLFAFNTSNSVSESDIMLNLEFADKLTEKGVTVVIRNDIDDPIKMINAIQEMDFMFCSRFHSVVFSLIAETPFMALYTSSKIEKLLKDTNNTNLGCKFLCDSSDKPIFLNRSEIRKCIDNAFDYQSNATNNVNIDFKSKQLIINEKRKRVMYIANKPKDPMVVLNKCKSIFSKTKDEDKAKDYAHTISFLLTGSIQSPYVWGLTQNILKEDFCLETAIKYIHKDIVNKTTNQVFYLPEINYKNKKFITFDDQRCNFEGIHRSGWAYTISGLMHMNAELFDKINESVVYLDTYVDRTFHWGQEALKAADHLPYRQDWIGIIHHTYDTTYSTYNCHELFKNETFLESLKSCKGLITLSEYLAKLVRKSIASLKMKNKVPVYAINHPMEFVDKQWSLCSFLNNNDRKVIQIGAWLRNPFSFYELAFFKNPLRIKKFVLKGAFMDNQFMSDDLLMKLKDLLVPDNNKKGDPACMCRNPIPDNEPACMCRNPNSINKWAFGLYHSIITNLNTVQVVDKITNDDYDDLLAKNILFLNLIDCSAVNTVLEAIVRNTPIFINRHEALEEVLGKNYPGFYDRLEEAEYMITDINTIITVHEYLKHLKKDKFSLETFVKNMDNIISNL